VSARVYIVGGAAMALAYDAARITRDIDGLILEGHGELTEAVRQVARTRGLPGSWLNEQATAYLPPGDNHRGRVVYDHPNLRILAAEPEKMLAMKVRAARRPDVADIQLLIEMLGLRNADQVFDVVSSVFPGQEVPARGRAVVVDLFEVIDGTDDGVSG